MEENLRRLLLAFEDWLVRQRFNDDVIFLTPEEWKARSEDCLNDAVYVIVSENSTVNTMLYMGWNLIVFDEIFQSFGFRYELRHSWSLGIYPLKNYDFTQTRPGTQYKTLLDDPRWKKKSELVKMLAGSKCQDCGKSGRLETHHCYYARMSDGFNPWEYPLNSLRALCKVCHVEREKVEMTFRAWSAEFTHKQIMMMMEGVSTIGCSMGHDKLFELLHYALGKDIDMLEKIHESMMAERGQQ
ncbi:HNH endonuclease [Pseudomonas germanica]